MSTVDPVPPMRGNGGVMIRKWSVPDNGYINVAIVDEYPPASIPANSGYPQTLAGARAKLVDDLVKALNETIATHAPAPGTPIFSDPQRQATYDYLIAHTLYNPTTATWSKR